METRPKIIFLDIDGVLNSTRSAVVLDGFGHPGHCEDGLCPKFDPLAVGLLRYLVETTGAKIVLSSSWRTGLKPGMLERSLAEHYAWPDAPIIGTTPDLGDLRGEEVAAWLAANGAKEYVILDDNSGMLAEHRDRFVQTDFRIGLTYEDVAGAAAILGSEQRRVI